MQIIVDELLTQYELSGKGKLVVLLHGWADSSRTFAHLQTSLARNYEVLAINLPGFGGSQRPALPWGLSDYSRFVQAVLHKLNKQAYAFIGHSNGGAIAIHGIVTQQLQADKLVLLASAGIRGDKKAKRKALQLVVKGGKLLSAPLPARVKRHLRRKTYQFVGSDMLVAEDMQATFKKIIADDVRGDARKVHIPTLLLYGEHDQATPVEYGELLHRAITGSMFRVVANAGHFIHHDQPDEVELLIEEFLS